MSYNDMRMEKKSDRRWRQRIRRDVLTSRAPTQPYKCAGCPRHFLLRAIRLTGISPSESHGPTVHDGPGKPPQKAKTLEIPRS